MPNRRSLPSGFLSSRRRPSAAVRAAASCVEGLEPRRLMHGDHPVVDLAINFAPKRVPGVSGWLADVGEGYGERSNGLIYGWKTFNSPNHRDRNVVKDQRLDTTAAMQIGGRNSWELELADGDYKVTVTAGDAKYFDSVNVINVEGSNVVKHTPSSGARFATKSRVITVTDGRLTVRPGTGARNAKINSIRVEYVEHEPASVTATALDATAVEGSADTGVIRLARDKHLDESLTVALAWSGSAGSKDLSSSRPTTATFAVGESTIDLPVIGRVDALDERAEAAWVTVQPGSAYAVGAPAAASVLIQNAAAVDESFSDISWSQSVQPPTSYTEAASAVVDGKLYKVGGFNGSFIPQSAVFEWDGTTWATKASAPRAFTHSGTAVVDDTIWFVGGYIGDGSGGQVFGDDKTLIYTPATDSWSTGPSLPAARAAGNLVVIGRRAYYVGGENFNRTQDVATMWSIDLDDLDAGWRARPPMPMARNHASALNVNGKLVVLVGQTGFNESLTTHDEFQIYDPATDAWTVPAQRLPQVRSQATYSSLFYRDRIIIIGGQSDYNVPTNTVWSVDPRTLVTDSLSPFPDSRFSSIAGVIDDKVYVFSGYKGFIATTPYVGTFVV